MSYQGGGLPSRAKGYALAFVAGVVFMFIFGEEIRHWITALWLPVVIILCLLLIIRSVFVGMRRMW